MVVKSRKIVLTIICLAFIISTIVIIHYSYAKYQTSKSGNAVIAGATWSVSTSSNDSSIGMVAANSTPIYTITVNNNSQVEVKYSITLSNLPNDIQLKLDNGSYVTPVNNQVTFSNVGELNYTNTTSRNHTITFNSTLNSNAITNQNIRIDVLFEQKTSN